ncbi:porin [Neisseria sp. CCUG12390]|uniref:porin n=1 Tax=Neisseria sp. CCUG12390 TaxID=3392035 RepID=UPI003A0FFC69
MKTTAFILTALLLSAPAFAEVKIYGELKSGVESSRTKINGQSVSGTRIADQGSFVGLRGSHPIGGSGNQVTWQWEQDAPSASERRSGKNSGSLREQWRERKQRGESYVGFGRDK